MEYICIQNAHEKTRDILLTQKSLNKLGISFTFTNRDDKRSEDYNARLIAAAEEMSDLLECMIASVNTLQERLDRNPANWAMALQTLKNESHEARELLDRIEGV